MIFDCPACDARVRSVGADAGPEVCPVCAAWIDARPVPRDQICGSEFHDRLGTPCQRRPHVADEHDPEHCGFNPISGAWVRWRDSEVGG